MRPMIVLGKRVAILGLTAGLLAVFLRNADLPLVWREMRGADWRYIALAIATIYLDVMFRSLRWQHLLMPLGSVGFGESFRATMIGLAATTLLPARAGDALRPYLIARRHGFSATAAFATIVLELVLDLLTVTVLVAVVLTVFDAGMRGESAYGFLRSGAAIVGGIALAILAALFFAARSPEKAVVVVHRVAQMLPSAAASTVVRATMTFVDGLAVVRRPGAFAAAIGWSMPLWLCVAAGVFLVSRGFHIDVPFAGSILISAMLVVAAFAPTPGAIGGFHAAYRFGVTAMYAAAGERAVGAALVLHAVTVLPVVLAGIAYFAAEGFSLRAMRRVASADAEDRPVPAAIA